MKRKASVLERKPADRNEPSQFIHKLYEIVDDKTTNHIISWDPDGLQTFVVWRTVECAREILPAYFKHSKLCSFVRQLNFYGFRKLSTCRFEFTHPSFKKGDENLLSKIKRRPPGATHSNPLHAISVDAASSSMPANINITAASTSADAMVHEILEENKKLRRINLELNKELLHTRHLYAQSVKVIEVAKSQCEFMANLHKGKAKNEELFRDTAHPAKIISQGTRLFGVTISRP
ncbi:hypothetical protein ACP70R_034416 [Stipagrostis hirtigluma subsp. patula]